VVYNIYTEPFTTEEGTEYFALTESYFINYTPMHQMQDFALYGDQARK
jgi:hypothetical protein